MYGIHYFLEEKMTRWERQTESNQAGIAIVKRYSTKLYREWLQHPKARKGTTRLNESTNQSYKQPQLRDDEDTTALMFAQMETRHQEQMDSLCEIMQQAKERSMKMAKNKI